MDSPASKVQLSELDAELTLIGSILLSPEAFGSVASAVKAEWFSDQFARYLFEAAKKIHDAGNRLSTATMMAALPEDCGGITRGQLYSNACAHGVPIAMLGGIIATIKDRWARRALVSISRSITDNVEFFDADPYEIAGLVVSDLDTICAIKAERAGGSIRAATDALFENIRLGTGMKGASTGLRVLDNKINGYKAGQLYVIAGRPGMGKSAFMCSSLRRTAASGVGVAIFSLEMSKEEISARMISDACDVTSAPHFGSILRGEFGPDKDQILAEAKFSVDAGYMHIDDSSSLTFVEIAGRARKVKAEMDAAGVKLAVLCIDHMGLVRPSDRYKGNKVAEAGEVSGRARELAKDLDCCVILLCQLSREVEKRDDKRPVMSDLRWSGEIEQDAHVIGFLYREEYYLNQQADPDVEALRDARWKMEFLIRKNRNGSTDDVRLWCSIAHSSIRDSV